MNKKIAFINPSVDKYSDLKLWSTDFMKKVMGRDITMMPKLIGMVLASLTPKEFEYIYYDEEIEEIIYDDIDADLIAITAMTVQINRAYEIAEEFKKRKRTVVIGGIHASIYPDEVLLHCDSVMKGEGENLWIPFLEDYTSGKLQRIYDAKDYPLVSEFVSPKIDIIKHDRYLQYPIQATRGCPYNCDFCSIKYSSGRKYRYKPIEQVVSEIKEYEKYNKGLFKKSYFFVDDNLYVDREYTKELFTALADLHITWLGQGTLNTANDDEILELMAKSGCRNFSIGFESISQESLAEANKPKCNQVEQYSIALDKLSKHGIIPAGTFIFGFDSDDIHVFERTVEFTLKTHLYTPFFNILTPLPGTQLRKRMENSGRIIDNNWKNYNALKCVFLPAKMTKDELEEGAYWASLEISKMDNFKRHLEAFWKYGPWKTNPNISLIERVLLAGMAIKFWKKKKYRKFLFWVAFNPKAVDFNNIITAIVVNSMAEQLPPSFNPATRRQE